MLENTREAKRECFRLMSFVKKKRKEKTLRERERDDFLLIFGKTNFWIGCSSPTKPCKVFLLFMRVQICSK